MKLPLSWLVCGALLGSVTVLSGAPSIRILGGRADGENQVYVPASPAVFGHRQEKITIMLDGSIDAPAYLRGDLFQVAGKLTMPLAKDVHLIDGITFPNASRQELDFAINIPDVKREAKVLVRLSLVPNRAQATPVHLEDLSFDVFPASVTKELTDLLQPKPGGSPPIIVFGPKQMLRHFLTSLHVSFEDAGTDTPDRFDPSRLYFGELATDEQFQQTQDRSAGARLILFSTDESLPNGVYAERSNSGTFIHVTAPLLDNVPDDPRAQLAIIKIIHLLSASPISPN